jgi:nucleotidyltransferase/DNA polymerase involved in DNA repair
MTTFLKQAQLDSLYCSLEIPNFSAQTLAAYDEGLRQQPFVVTCQDAESHKSVVWACSREACDLGIFGGMPVVVVKRKFNNIPIILRNKELEALVVVELKNVLCRYSPDFEITEKGKCSINLTKTPSSRTMSLTAIADAVRGDIIRAIPLQDVAIGISQSRLVSQLMAKRAKPNGVCICEPGTELQTLSAIESKLLPGISSRSKERIGAYGLKCVGQIRHLGKETLMRHFGNEGEKLYSLTLGISSKSMAKPTCLLSAETVLDRDINDNEQIFRKVRYTVDKLCFLLKKNNQCVDRFQFVLTYGDNKSVQKTVAFPMFTNDFLTISGSAVRAFIFLYQRRVSVKSIRLIVKNPQSNPGQTSLFETTWEHKQQALSEQITRVRSAIKFDSVVSAVHVGCAAL